MQDQQNWALIHLTEVDVTYCMGKSGLDCGCKFHLWLTEVVVLVDAWILRIGGHHCSSYRLKSRPWSG